MDDIFIRDDVKAYLDAANAHEAQELGGLRVGAISTVAAAMLEAADESVDETILVRARAIRMAHRPPR